MRDGGGCDNGGAGPAMTLPSRPASLAGYALSLSRSTKRRIVVGLDAILCAVTCVASVCLRLGFFPTRDTPFILFIVVSIALTLPIFRALGLYREIFSQSGINAIVAI